MQSQWFETFFQGVAVDFWTQIIPHSLTLQEADYLERQLDVPPGSKLLDVPCGNGRHAIELARRGYDPTGVDLSQEFIRLAREAGSAAGVAARWHLSDMRILPWEAEFEGAYCCGNSFAYLDHAGISAFLAALSRALKPGGRLVVDNPVVAECILATPAIRRWHRTGDLFVLSDPHYVAEDSRLDIDYTFVSPGSIETRPASSYVFTMAELRRLFEQGGFEILSLHGGFAAEPFSLGSPRLLITARSHP